jgi:hypothetical protein
LRRTFRQCLKPPGGHRSKRLPFLPEQGRKSDIKRRRRIIGLAHRHIGEGRSAQDQQHGSAVKPAFQQAHYRMFPVISRRLACREKPGKPEFPTGNSCRH